MCIRPLIWLSLFARIRFGGIVDAVRGNVLLQLEMRRQLIPLIHTEANSNQTTFDVGIANSSSERPLANVANLLQLTPLDGTRLNSSDVAMGNYIAASRKFASTLRLYGMGAKLLLRDMNPNIDAVEEAYKEDEQVCGTCTAFRDKDPCKSARNRLTWLLRSQDFMATYMKNLLNDDPYAARHAYYDTLYEFHNSLQHAAARTVFFIGLLPDKDDFLHYEFLAPEATSAERPGLIGQDVTRLVGVALPLFHRMLQIVE